MDLIEITTRDIDVGAVLSQMSDPSAGGTACFVGTTRDTFDGKRVVLLEYEAYHDMATKELHKLAATMRKKWPLVKVALVHRIGAVPVAQTSVLVAASAVHRAEAIEAVRYGIDAIKADVPIWKKEIYDDGTCSWKENLCKNS